MNASETIDELILRSIRARRSASVSSAKQFEGVGKPAAVRQALSRLAKAGKIRRIRQRLYDLPRKHPIIGQTAPDPMAAVRALMEGSQAQWQVSGAYAANARKTASAFTGPGDRLGRGCGDFLVEVTGKCRSGG